MGTVYDRAMCDEENDRIAELEAENERLRAAVQRVCDEDDYCYACDNHPSHGHADDCPLKPLDAASSSPTEREHEQRDQE